MTTFFGDSGVASDSPQAEAGPSPAIAMHGAPALASDFDHLPYADPAAPQGGTIRYGERGFFDSLNPYTLKGRAPWPIRTHVVESLMERSWDEPFTLYANLASVVETPPDRAWVAFTIDPQARFSTGDPVTVDDVVFSLETLRDEGRPNHRQYYSMVDGIDRIGERTVRFRFEEPNRELPLLLGLMPVLSKADWEGRDFAGSGMRPIVGSGPYVIAEAADGRMLRLEKNPDYWAKHRPIAAGRHNFETVIFEYFRDGGALWEAFTAGAIDVFGDGDPDHWASAYDFPSAVSGAVVQTEIPHGRASGMNGFVFNTRRPIFADRRVREALALAFDYAWVNQTFYRGGFNRIRSYWSGSRLAAPDAASPAERALLARVADTLPAGALDAVWRPPVGAGDGRNRRALRQARALLEEAGWRMADGALRDASGAPMAFEILLGSNDVDRIAAAFADNLARLGVTVTRRVVDQAQYQDRLRDFDFDMIVRRWGLSLSPGEEQRFYWSADAADTPGTRNYMGARDPAVDAMVDAMLAAEDRAAFEVAVQALDRVLSSGVYVIPFGYLATDRVAHDAALRKPARDALYGYRPDVWWRAPAE